MSQDPRRPQKPGSSNRNYDIPFTGAGPASYLVHLARRECSEVVEAGEEVLRPRDVRDVNDLCEDTQHLHLAQHVLAAGGTQYQQLPALTSSPASATLCIIINLLTKVTVSQKWYRNYILR